MCEEAYTLSIHLGKRKVSLNGLPENQFQLVHWWRSGGEILGAEAVVGCAFQNLAAAQASFNF